MLDEQSCLYKNLNKEMVLMEKVESKYEQEELRNLIENHVKATGSQAGRRVLEDFRAYLPKFKKIIPKDYKELSILASRYEEVGMTREEAQIEAFYESIREK